MARDFSKAETVSAERTPIEMPGALGAVDTVHVDDFSADDLNLMAGMLDQWAEQLGGWGPLRSAIETRDKITRMLTAHEREPNTGN